MEFDLGAIVRAAGERFTATHPTSAAQRKVLSAIAACRTCVLGGERQQCDRCGFEHILWHSCRNRHCPRCQASARAEWMEARSEELLPVPYFHVVFTVPEALNVLARWAPRVFYDVLFRAAGQALLDAGRSKLGVHLGALCVLHTWGQTLMLHPHIHCVVPGGGFAEGNGRWRSVRKPSFFLPVKVLSRRFRTLVCTALRQAWTAGELPIEQPVIADSVALDLLLARACSQEWVAYAKPPFGGPRQVLAYLAAYTHRIAISNRRLIAFDGHSVAFAYRDYADANRSKTMRLDVDEFLRRFLLHVIPARFVRIRYYGFLSHRCRHASLSKARLTLGASPPSPQSPPLQKATCPRCRQGHMQPAGEVRSDHASPTPLDSS